MARLHVSRAARRDLTGIFEYIARDDEPAAERHHQRLAELFFTIAGQPAIGRPRPDLNRDVRSIPCGAYVIYYQTTSKAVRILRVVHGARDIYRLWNK